MADVKWLDRRIAAPGPFMTLCLTDGEFRKALKHCGVVDSETQFMKTAHADATVHWMENRNGDLCCIVCLGDCSGRSGVEIAGLLVHEAVHVWQRYCDRIGEHSPGVEQEAYAVQSIAQELMAEYVRKAAPSNG